ncbi:MAG: type IV pili twitching motility protein PilT, partial [Acidovorax sp.]
SRGVEQGMCSFDQSLFALAESGAISAEEAIAHADNRTDLSLKLRLAAGGSLTVAGMGMRENMPPV